MADREIIRFSKQGFATLNTELNASDLRDDGEMFEELDERTDRVAIGRRDDEVAFAMSRDERALAQTLVDEKREQFKGMLDRGQEQNIFGSVRQQKTDTETARLDLAGAGIEDNRSPEARASDRGKDAPLTTDPDKWRKNKDEFDFPGVDTGPEFREDPPRFF